MTHIVAWGLDETLPERQPRVPASTIVELDEVLDRIAAAPEPTAVDIIPADIPPGERRLLQIGLGHPQRSFVFYLGAPAGGYARESGVPEWDEEIVFDHGGEPTEYLPEWTRVTPMAAREAAREYLRTGTRLTLLGWPT